MAKTFSFGSADVRIGDPGAQPEPAEPDAPFRILVAGDFGGRAARGQLEGGAALAGRRILKVDRDTLDDALGSIAPEVSVPAGSRRATLRLREMDDFHPDRIFARVERFAALKHAADDAASRRSTRPAPSAGLLDAILEGKVEERPVEAPATDPAADMDAAMREVLHDPAFQGVEAAWRGVDFLLRRLDTDGPLSIHLLDLSFDELASDVLASEALDATALHRILVEKTVGTPGGEPWAALTLLFSFEKTREEAEVLGRLARIASRAGTAVLAGAASSVLGCTSIVAAPDPREWGRSAGAEADEAWRALQRLPEARYLGLALPRLLLRLPYGPETDPAEEFDFDELGAAPRHDAFLWGSPSVATTLLLAQAFDADGWDLRPGSVQEIDALPFAMTTVDGEKVAVPCAETLLTVRAAEAIANAGLMPLLTLKGTDRVRLGIYQSFAEPQAPLAGRWRG